MVQCCCVKCCEPKATFEVHEKGMKEGACCGPYCDDRCAVRCTGKGGPCSTFPLLCCGTTCGEEALAWAIGHPINPPNVGIYDMRPIMDQENPGTVRILKDIPKGARTGGCMCAQCVCCCNCCLLDCTGFMKSFVDAERVRGASEYVWLQENRLEVNIPVVRARTPSTCAQYIAMSCGCSACSGSFGVVDQASVYYFDNEMFDTISGKSSCISKFKEWWCGSYGSPISFKSRPCPLVCPCIPAWCCGYTTVRIHVPNGEAAAYVKLIKDQRDIARANAKLRAAGAVHTGAGQPVHVTTPAVEKMKR